MANPINSGIRMSDLKSKIMRPSLSSVYGVIIKQPPGLNFEGFDGQLMELTCVEASLPGSSLGTIDTNRDYRGVIEKHAYSKLYDDTIDFTFMVTMDPDDNPQKSYIQIKFFEAWMRYIVGEDVGDKVLKSKTFQSTLRYPIEYQSDLAIIKFEKDLGFGITKKSNILAYEFVQAFPKSISSTPVSYDGSQVLKVTVSFTYTRYFVSDVSDQIDASYIPPSLLNPNSPGNPEFAGLYSSKEFNLSGKQLDFFRNVPDSSMFGSTAFPVIGN